MLNTNSQALGIIFPNSYDTLMPELANERLMASIPFASRYRMIDFVLSSMVNSGIDNVSLIVRKNYLSLLDHLGSGREWDLTRKNGGLNIVPPFSMKTSKIYSGRVDALISIVNFLKRQKEEYVVMSDANIAANIDFRAIIDAHIASGADVTVAYKKNELPAASVDAFGTEEELYYTLDVEDGRVKKIKINETGEGEHNLSMNIYVIRRTALIEMIAEAYVKGHTYFERDILLPQLEELNVQAYEFTGYAATFHDLKSYFKESMALLEQENLDGLFGGAPIYTKIRDDNPTRYIAGAKVKNTMAADGCIIEGEVENCILFRGVKVAKGAKVKNCILMQDTVVGEGVSIEYAVSDKDVTITDGTSLKGTENFPIYIGKGQTV
ncbi:MAG: glucose-1-phosphate adenylyltransferase subunit GlgD [Lachnospiraceae bacterium]|nr:glucose-1-phosphate adenylyltransferase subunit GlgD [Lachnospiraceae bacterium]